MFTTKCFIRKNTSELRKKLEEFGYKNRHLSMSTNAENYPLLLVYHDGYYQGVFGDECGLEFYIDCGENEELFLAIAALRDDTDKNQWVIDEANECFGWEDSWMICDKDDMNERAVYTHYRKATVEEIIEHFKDK